MDERRKNVQRTGGGPPSPPLTATEENVATMIGDSASPIECQYYDDDATFYEVRVLNL